MQDCCRTAPRRARYVVMAIVVLAAIALALMERSGEEAATTATTGQVGR